MIWIDYKDRRPIYEQVIEKFQQMILCGVLKPEEPMPSVRSLAMELSINPNTIQRAYQELERDGYIYTIKGKGSFVSDASFAAESKRRKLREEFQCCVEKALAAGMTGAELTELLQQSIHAVQLGDGKLPGSQKTDRQESGNQDRQESDSRDTERRGEK